MRVTTYERIRKEVEAFAAMHPRFDQVADEMTRLIRAHNAPLAGAYRVAYYRRFS